MVRSVYTITNSPRILKRNKGLCQICLCTDVVREAKTAGHIIPKAHGGTNSDGNQQSQCYLCNKTKTAREFFN